MKSYKSTCSYCGVGCGIIINKDSKGKIEVIGDPDYPVNKGMLCSKGMNLNYVVEDTSDRILHPEMRWSKKHPMQKVTWDTALDRAAAVFKSIIKKYGPNSVGFYVSGQCLTEEYYLVNKLTKGFLGTNNIDTNSRLCMSSAVVGYKKSVGDDMVPISYEDIEIADTFLITGANPAWTHPIIYRRLEAHKQENPNVKVIVVDPRKTATCAIADLHIQINPGTDVVFHNAVAKRLIDKNKIDTKFIEEHTLGFGALKLMLEETSISESAKICDISVDDIKTAAKYIGDAKAFLSMWTMGLNQSVIGVDKNTSLINISLLTGQISKPGAGPFSLTGQPNAMGGREVGGMANLLAAHRDLQNPTHRKEVENFWNSNEISPKPGLTGTEMFKSLESGELKAIWIIGTNPVVSMPNSKQVERALEKANFVVVQDISHSSETTKYADLLLPAAGWLEKDGTMTNSERRMSYLPKVIDAPGEALSDVDILVNFAKKMDFWELDYESTSDVFDEHCQLTKNTNIDISGLSYDRLVEEGSMQWPVPNSKHKGTPRLFTDKKFATPSGKATFNIPENTENLSEKPDNEHPFILTTGRIRDQWHTRTKTGKVNRLNTHIPSPFLEMHPKDAVNLNLKDEDIVVISNKFGEARVKVTITEDIKQGVVFLPMHWGKILGSDFGRANNLTSDLIDPISKEPDYKYTAVSVKKFKKEKQKICIIGAGAAAYRFIQTYRNHNAEDEIEVFSGEKHPFYNRVLLPEYVSEELSWSQLLKMKEGEVEKLNVNLHSNTKISEINNVEKYIIDDKGEKHVFNKLIIATGSRSFVPNDAYLHLPGRFTMRNKDDADRLRAHLESTGLPANKQHTVIIGGGLLGLELAASLKKKNINVTIIQRASRLMERQLDRVASRLLAENVQEKGIQIYFNNEVSTVFENENNPNQLSIALKTGKILNANAIVYAIGTTPNYEIVKGSDIKYKRGIIVNQYLQTNDPDVFALGEVAQFNDAIFGITSAAEQQADIAAKFILGDLNSIYSGSTLMNILKFEDLELCSIGMVNSPKNNPSYEEIILMDVSKQFYKKCIVKNDLLVGTILMGDKSEFAEFKRMIEDKIELSDKRSELLRGQSKSIPVKGKLVCSCSQVGEGNLIDEIKTGTTDFNELCSATGAGLGCGSCKPEVNDILQRNI